VLAFDTETTGLGDVDQVLQLGWVLLDGAVESDSYERLWRTSVPVHPGAERVHGISSARSVSLGLDPAPELRDFMALAHRTHSGGGVLVAHNANFDVKKLCATARACGVSDFVLPPVFCTLRAARKVRSPGLSCALGPLHVSLGGDPLTGRHSALSDARSAAHIFREGARRGLWACDPDPDPDPRG
jgi:DNA polymerase III epsilon subunit-like protein